jgi:hypothetical protein
MERQTYVDNIKGNIKRKIKAQRSDSKKTKEELQ